MFTNNEQKILLIYRCLLLVLLLLLIVGCTNPQVIYKNNTINITIYKNNTVYINNITTVTEPCNHTCPESNISYDRSYTLELIRRIKFLEGQTNIYFNDTECSWELNQSNVKLKECEDVMCDNWNSSWC